MKGPPVQAERPGSAVSCQLAPPSKLTPTKLACKSCPTQVVTRWLEFAGSTAIRVSNWSLKFMLPGGLNPVSQPASESGSFETWVSGPTVKSLASLCQTSNPATATRSDQQTRFWKARANCSALRQVPYLASAFSVSANW